MSVIYNKSFIATATRKASDHGMTEQDIFETYGTKYGLFIPTDLLNDHFLDWVNSDFSLEIDACSAIVSTYIHVSNAGKLYLVSVDSNLNGLYKIPHSTDRFMVANGSGDHFVAQTWLIEKCATITQCVDILEKQSVSPMLAPQIIAVDDWVRYALEKNYTDVFIRRKFKFT